MKTLTSLKRTKSDFFSLVAVSKIKMPLAESKAQTKNNKNQSILFEENANLEAYKQPPVEGNCVGSPCGVSSVCWFGCKAMNQLGLISKLLIDGNE